VLVTRDRRQIRSCLDVVCCQGCPIDSIGFLAIVVALDPIAVRCAPSVLAAPVAKAPDFVGDGVVHGMGAAGFGDLSTA
jgi:hypothetical protein